ncbi:uncharacterized protein PgNI_01840 [Pyricularia grisea]|uniref:Uncharacterized protein n=1 Tax=Pyricularia grisea TaxID=148305 RepID=A0A6P8BLY1_PYRGI|nr:uncharacterized protein PgNI_01840 [Pyricularia grisea]TLD17823.1 hypothetical protein PgNI_01840 [Pyricularia grisea]
MSVVERPRAASRRAISAYRASASMVVVDFVGSRVDLGVGVVPESEKLDLGYVSVDPCTRCLPTDFTARVK